MLWCHSAAMAGSDSSKANRPNSSVVMPVIRCEAVANTARKAKPSTRLRHQGFCWVTADGDRVSCICIRNCVEVMGPQQDAITDWAFSKWFAMNALQ